MCFKHICGSTKSTTMQAVWNFSEFKDEWYDICLPVYFALRSRCLFHCILTPDELNKACKNLESHLMTATDTETSISDLEFCSPNCSPSLYRITLH